MLLVAGKGSPWTFRDTIARIVYSVRLPPRREVSEKTKAPTSQGELLMVRKIAWFLALASLALLSALALSCGSSSSPKACTATYNVVGDWELTVTNTSSVGSLTEYGAIDSAGLALFFDNTLPSSSGDSAELPVISGSCSFSGNVNAYSEP